MSSALTPPERQRRLDVARTVAREAGAVAMARFRDRAGLEVSTKTGGVYDTVSEVDRAVESLIRRRLMAAFPEDRCLGEEGGADPDAAHARCLWVIDPIDGTDCFVNGIPVWSVSLALLSRGAVHAGVVYDPNAGELFAMAMGEGAFLNGEPLTPSPATHLAEGVLGVGISHRVPPEPTLELMGRLLAAGGIYQRNGSGALMLAYVAAGRLLGYYEPHINSWDVLAGIGLVRESGGWTSDFLAADGLLEGNEIIACAPGLVDTMQALVRG